MTDASGGLVSQHPTDRLIRELIHAGRPATAGETEQIIERMATAPFDQRVVPVGIRQRGLTYQGITLANRADSLMYHLAQRVLQDKQWADGTTAD